MLLEGLLHRVQLAVGGQALDGRDVGAVGLDGEHRARLHRLAVEEDGARPARRRVAADVGAGEAEHLPQVVDEQHPGLDLVLLRRAVDRHGYPHWHHPPEVCQSAKRGPSCHSGPGPRPPKAHRPRQKFSSRLASFMPGCTVVQVGSPFPPAALPKPPGPSPRVGGRPFPGVSTTWPPGRRRTRPPRRERLALAGQVADVAPELQPAGLEGLLGVQLAAAEGGGHLPALDAGSRRPPPPHPACTRSRPSSSTRW